jgi:hypothetical protein
VTKTGGINCVDFYENEPSVWGISLSTYQKRTASAIRDYPAFSKKSAKEMG